MPWSLVNLSKISEAASSVMDPLIADPFLPSSSSLSFFSIEHVKYGSRFVLTLLTLNFILESDVTLHCSSLV